jgi:gliding motility-associated-like protein
MWELDDASFAFPGLETNFCNRQANVTPIAVLDSGTYAMVADTGAQGVIDPIDPITGEINLLQSTADGEYQISYTTNGQCPSTSTVVISISDVPDSRLRAEPNDTICVGESVDVKASGGATKFVFYRGFPPDSIDNRSFHHFTDIITRDTIRVTLRNTYGCQVRDSIVIVANQRPVAIVTNTPDIISANTPFEVGLQSLSNNTFFEWRLDSVLGGANLNPEFGITDTINAGETTSIVQQVTLDSDFNPASFIYLVTPWSEGCRGAEQRIRIKVNPFGSDVFVPQVFTPDGNGFNETWMVQLKDGLDPNNYSIDLFNEAGAKVYTMHPLVSTWNAGTLPDGVYWYILKDSEGGMIEAAGLTIRRK